ncbi:MAG: hypothetical protein IIA67_05615 [Planctomycetes bacterium]|nr:hypothetical protein [Planctomycetota bacterium]
MTKLASLRNRLDGLRRRRRTARWGTGYSALVSSVLCALVLAFIVDFLLFQGFLGVGPRLFILLVVVGTSVGAFFLFTFPFLGTSESIVDMALLVERQQLDPDHRDLVAAMQFESPEANQWGSLQLETAVIDYVVEFGQGLDVYQGFSREQMTRRVSLLAVVVAIVGIGIFTAPQVASVFLNRLLLGSRHYPTNTHIELIVVNDTPVLNGEKDGTRPNDVAKGAQGKQVTFTVLCSGELPDEGEVALLIGKSAHGETLKLTRLSPEDRRQRLQEALDEVSLAKERSEAKISGAWLRRMALLARFDAAEAAEAIAGAGEDRKLLGVAAGHLRTALDDWSDEAIDDAIYVARLERFSEAPIDFGVTLGDAWTDLARLWMIPLPLIEVQSKITPPEYAAVEPEQDVADEQDGKLTADSLDVSVLEGSRVDLDLTSSKPLQDATITIDGKDYALQQTDEDGKAWHLADKTPLAVVRKPIKYLIQVTDKDDLQLEYPKQGFVGLKADRPPTIVAGIRKLFIKTDYVTPAGGATLVYDLNDDHGIVKVTLEGEIVRRKDGVAETITLAPLSVFAPSKPLLRNSGNLPRNGEKYRWYVGSLKLPDGKPAKPREGDKLQLRFAATDYRGEFKGNTTYSETLILTITDEAGLIKATLASDRILERRLNDAAKFAAKGDLK